MLAKLSKVIRSFSMDGGQVMDLAMTVQTTGIATLKCMQQTKTGALINAATGEDIRCSFLNSC
jgi:geranylgeranyl pyrophosphate synthase